MNENNNGRAVNRRQLLRTIGALGVSASFASGVQASDSGSRSQIEYENLTDTAKTVFRLGLEEGRSEEYHYEQFPEQLLEYETIIYNGEQYSLNRDYQSESRSQIEPEAVDENDLGPHDKRDLINYEDLGPDAVTVFATALQEGVFEQYWQFPEEFTFQNRFVKYGDEYYDLNFLHEDDPVFTIAPSVEGAN
jgi:hypothetical protein